MIENNDKDEWIEQYLQGELSGPILDEFKDKFASDDLFRKEVALQKSIIRNIKETGRKEWILKLEEIHREMSFSGEAEKPAEAVEKKLTPVKNIHKKNYYFAAAASVILIIFSTILFTRLHHGPDAKRTFLAYYQPYPDLDPATRSWQNGTQSPKKEAFMAYDKGNYQQSIILFKNILEKGEDEMVLFYLGNAYLSDGKPAEAENTFKRYLAQYKEFITESNWYLSLSYVKQEKLEAAKKLLGELVKENNDYSKKAAKVLSEL